ncbi:MAG: hypothetical protein UZ12_BCD005000672 [Bacteroidetes bacterium OLB12]|nr:MAG: hypothetical protein UZ12_BCD005000672 [Bacteroidetes bacterium OLB12]
MQNTTHTVRLEAITHRDKRCLAIYFGWVPELKKAIRQVEGVRWSKTQKCWWLPLSRENYRIVLKTIEPFAEIDDQEIRQLLNAIPEKSARSLPIEPNRSFTSSREQEGKGIIRAAVHPVNNDVLPRMRQQLLLKSYSPSTNQNLYH